MTAHTAHTDRVLKLVKIRRLATSGEAKQIRLAHGLSLREVGEPLGIATTTLYRWEQGRNVPRSDAAVRWMDLLDALQVESTP